ncbi:GAF domain-containing protein [Methylobacterium sp. Leaf123]|uniref:GAF domain-containing protein n=1 Tax=Methylobacterium sp. Leaf123 TaxID=1736264 RepID=UPI0025702656|nr:GAF domain-containing protein [Methylobacterium sp. Leaf123]
MTKTALTWPMPPSQSESRRLAALRRLQLLDTPADPAFDRITQLAQTLFDVPIALISLIDEDRQWFKAKCGLHVSGTPREQAFCNYTILHDSVFVVPDARAHADFAMNPLVTGEPFIRFYAGAPLIVAPETRIGSLCIIDTELRAFNEEDSRLLARLAQVVTDEIWLRTLASGQSPIVPHFVPDRQKTEPAPLITGVQVRAARAMLGWSIDALSLKTGLSPNTIKRMEADEQSRPSSQSTAAKVMDALEGAGIVFIGHDAANPGVQLLSKPARNKDQQEI